MEVMDEDEEDCPLTSDEKEQETQDNKKDEQAISYYISMNAMAGVHNFITMRLTSSSKGKSIHILIDTGSTHNFLDLQMAKRLGCRLESTEPFPVAVADGNKTYSTHTSRELKWKMQGVEFTADRMTLPLGGCDMVLGVQWLIGLGDIKWNFDQLKMEFHINGKKVSLRGKQPAPLKLNSGKAMRQTLQKPGQISMLHVGVIQEKSEQEAPLYILEDSANKTKDLEALLAEFEDLFKEPQRLPHMRNHDHAIVLKEGTSAMMSDRRDILPYRKTRLRSLWGKC